MADELILLRTQHLLDHLQKDLILLKRYEDALRVETDPRRQLNFEENITSLKAVLAERQREYAILASRLNSSAGLNLSPRLEVDIMLEKISTQIGELANRMETLHLEAVKQTESVAENIIAEIMNNLAAEQASLVQRLEASVQQSLLSQDDIEILLTDVGKALNKIAEQPQKESAPSLLVLAKEIIDSPRFDVTHKIKVAIPLVPFFLSYEGEVGLGDGLNLRNLWMRLTSKASAA